MQYVMSLSPDLIPDIGLMKRCLLNQETKVVYRMPLATDDTSLSVNTVMRDNSTQASQSELLKSLTKLSHSINASIFNTPPVINVTIVRGRKPVTAERVCTSSK